MKVFINNIDENWIVDRLRKEFYEDNQEILTNNIKDADILWIIAPWTWKKIPKKFLKQKTVLCTIHHIDEEKFIGDEGKDFYKLDKYVDYYHTISKKSFDQLSKFTSKKIFKSPFWVNNKIWFPISENKDLKSKFYIPSDAYIIGSFQRDTEGKDGISPKLSKGPDQLFEIIKSISEQKNIFVILAGHRRTYLINLLEENNVPYKYFERVDLASLNELYNCLDLYIVSSRVEGGPQAIFECALSRTPIISTDVGVASEILSETSIFNMSNFTMAKPDIEVAYRNSIEYLIPKGYKYFIKLFEEIL
jgi:glycosyltransferase involved in cell wall biosynthesis